MQKQEGIIHARQSTIPHVKKLSFRLKCAYCEQSLVVVGSEYRCPDACSGVSIVISNLTNAWNEINLRFWKYPHDLKVTITVFAENDLAHNRYEIQYKPSTEKSDAQMRECLDYCEKNGLTVLTHFIETGVL